MSMRHQQSGNLIKGGTYPAFVFLTPNRNAMLDDFKNRIASLNSFDFGKELNNIVEQNADKIPDLLAQQLAQGKDGNNEPVLLNGSPEYAPFTIEIKDRFGKGLGAITDRVTNYMTGAFYESMKTNVENNAFETIGDVPYFDDIIERSGSIVMELNESSRIEFGQKVTLPAIKEVLKTKTGLTIT